MDIEFEAFERFPAAENAAALVGAGVLTVLVFPALVVALDRRPAEPAPAPAGGGAAGPR